MIDSQDVQRFAEYPADDVLAALVLDAVKQWRFKPATRDGVAVEAKVALPVKIVDAPADYARFASN